jgi:protein TonB
MKLDILKQKWVDLVFEGKNKSYGAYDLRTENPGTTLKALILGILIFSFLVATPMISAFIGKDKAVVEEDMNKKIVTIKLPPPKIEEPIIPLAPPPPPPPRVDQVKFVKPVVAKAEEVVEEPPKIKEIIKKQIGDETIKGDPDAKLTIEPVGKGPIDATGGEDTKIYSTAGIEQKPEFPGGIANFYKFVGNNFKAPEEEGLKGKVLVTFVVEKDGSLTDIKVVRDIGFGTAAEAIRVLKKSPKWAPGEQNGKRVRVQYSLPITIQSAY